MNIYQKQKKYSERSFFHKIKGLRKMDEEIFNKFEWYLYDVITLEEYIDTL